ncbi:hypothetical protein C8Q69DRAFT_519793 [Paecilomyces variotii]|uniref:Uncharacterized protein n=1 Tax=Byssochlamys spectabilis TaxID=264951 RepID=A0A443HWW7_BYSSP|nr:hypothetical protein C8Q69DRAFT_519793 [Paecilomyces variotii]RWQ96326.1 hypothetical protein C8Q69DRAFT_519793 [Paecilomyces variotii]
MLCFRFPSGTPGSLLLSCWTPTMPRGVLWQTLDITNTARSAFPTDRMEKILVFRTRVVISVNKFRIQHHKLAILDHSRDSWQCQSLGNSNDVYYSGILTVRLYLAQPQIYRGFFLRLCGTNESTNCTATDPGSCSNAHSSCGCLGHSSILILLSNQLVCAAEKSQDQRDLREEEVGEASDLEVLRNPFLCCCRTSCSPGNFLVDVIPERYPDARQERSDVLSAYMFGFRLPMRNGPVRRQGPSSATLRPTSHNWT